MASSRDPAPPGPSSHESAPADPLELRLSSALAERYLVERQLGAGGMATVWLARDLKHDREVAIKVVHPDLGAAIGPERFLAEVRTTARLQHPHILPLLDSGDAGEGLLYYVMPYVRGETLRARIARERQLPVAETIRIARDVASALDHAHRHGIVHRDVKPENILLQDGQALVADFGIALAMQQAGDARLTQSGLSLGTPQYMSPEQAAGEKQVDARSDIYALGTLCYEMLAGIPPFVGPSVQGIVARVLAERPVPLRTLRESVPPHVEAAVATALAKVPADRFATAAEFAHALEASDHARTVSPVAAAPGRRSWRVPAMMVVVALVAATLAWGAASRAPVALDERAPVSRLRLTSEPAMQLHFRAGVLNELAISPDGRRAVFVVEHGSGSILAVRELDRLSARLLPGTENASNPAISPDGRWIAFEGADGTIRRIGVDGSGLAVVVQPGPDKTAGEGITWLSDDVLIYSERTRMTAALYSVSSAGGTPTRIVAPDSATEGERMLVAPRAAGDGRHVVFTIGTASAIAGFVGVHDARTGRTRRDIVAGLAGVLGFIDDLLVYARRDGALMAVPFELARGPVGTPVELGDTVAVHYAQVAASLSATGALLYAQGRLARELVRVGRDGDETLLFRGERTYAHPRFSPDGRRLAVGVVSAGGIDVWSIDLVNGTTERLTSGTDQGHISDRPEWSPDGRRILYSSPTRSPHWLWTLPADGSAPAEPLLTTNESVRGAMWAPDGRSVVYRVDAAGSRNRDIWVLPLDGSGAPHPLVATPADELQPRISPDGRWLAYVSNESGREEVYVRPYRQPGGRIAVSSEGAIEPMWAAGGMRLYYRAGEQLVEASLVIDPELRVAGRRVVATGAWVSDLFHPNYDVGPDGSFVMVRMAGDAREPLLVLNWARELSERTRGARR